MEVQACANITPIDCCGFLHHCFMHVRGAPTKSQQRIHQRTDSNWTVRWFVVFPEFGNGLQAEQKAPNQPMKDFLLAISLLT